MTKEIRKQKRTYVWSLALFGAVIILATTVLVIITQLQGSTSISNQDKKVEKVELLSCEGSDIGYPFLPFFNSNASFVKINATFNEENLSTISLMYQLSYDSDTQIKQATTNISITMNQSFHDNGLDRDALGLKVSSLQNVAQMTLYTESSAISEVAAKYFLLENVNDYKRNNLMSYYKGLGLDCVSN